MTAPPWTGAEPDDLRACRTAARCSVADERMARVALVARKGGRRNGAPGLLQTSVQVAPAAGTAIPPALIGALALVASCALGKRPFMMFHPAGGWPRRHRRIPWMRRSGGCSASTGI